VAETDGATGSAEQTADTLSTLVSESVRVPVLARHSADALAELRPTARAAVTGWLEQLAAVRPALQPLEAVLLDRTQLSLRSNRPRDLWQVRPNRSGDTIRASRLTLAVGPRAAFRSAEVHLAVVDRFAEVVPDPVQPTAAAFGFNAPGARPPQAVLLAVTPDVTKELDTPTLVEILAETRLLARARMARPEDLDELAALLPLTVFPAVGPSGVGLRPDREW
jgi:hypothetical protein